MWLHFAVSPYPSFTLLHWTLIYHLLLFLFFRTMSAGEAVRSVVLTGYGGYECLKVSTVCFHWCVTERKGPANRLCWWFLSAGAAMANPSARHGWCAGGRSGMWHEFRRPVYPPGAVACETAPICAGHWVCGRGDCCGGQCDTHQCEQETSDLEYFSCLWFFSASECT